MPQKRTTRPAICRQCDRDFMARTDGPGLYCSNTCKFAAKRLPPEEKRTRDRARNQAYYLKNREQLLEKDRQYRQTPIQRERIAAYGRAYRQANRERLLADMRARSIRTRDERRAYQRAHLERYAELARAWRLRNPDKFIALSAKCAAVKFGLTEHFTGTQWADLKTRSGYRCLRCNLSEPEIKLTVDHIVPMSKGGLNVIDNIQPLCGPCNSKKQDTLIVDYRVSIMHHHVGTPL